MRVRLSLLFIALTPILSNCSSTPGDAAMRAGHPEQAANLYEKGAIQGDKTAALKLGLMLSGGEVKAKKYGPAVQWFERACELGELSGCHNSGNAYEYGSVGATQDYNKAREFYTQAAVNGYIQSQYNLGSMYSNQYFDDDVEGLKWMLVALKSSSSCLKEPVCQWIQKDPPKHKENLTSRMTASQIAQANKLVTEEFVAK